MEKFSSLVRRYGCYRLLLAIIPKLGGQQNIFLMKAESPGPIIGKAVPRMRNYATMLYGIYITLTALEFILLLFGGLNVFEAINTSFQLPVQADSEYITATQRLLTAIMCRL